jgi:hypothetical protein
MTDWEKIAQEAKADALAKAFDKLITRDPSKMKWAPIDKEKIDAFLADIKANTNYANRVAAFKAVAATISEDGLKLLKSAMLALAAMFLMASAIQAQDVTVSGINIKDVLENTRAGVWLPLEGGRSFKTVYTPLIWFHGEDGTEYAAFDVGGAAPGELTKGYAFVALGFRVDTLLDKALNISPWFKKHISAATLPTIEAGVGPILYDSKVRFGASLALKF